MKSVAIEWFDSCSHESQLEIDAVEFDFFYWKTIGFVIEDSKDRIVLCRDVEAKDLKQARGVIIIPKKNITKIKELG
jgi:hypothetical protein